MTQAIGIEIFGQVHLVFDRHDLVVVVVNAIVEDRPYDDVLLGLGIKENAVVV